MRIPRIYHPEPLQINTTIALGDDAANHVGRVLRMTAGQKLELFDGSNQVFCAEISEATKRKSPSILSIAMLMIENRH